MDRIILARTTLILAFVQDGFAYIGDSNVPATTKAKAKAAKATAEQLNASVAPDATVAPATRVELLDATAEQASAVASSMNQIVTRSASIQFSDEDQAFVYTQVERMKAFCQQYGIPLNGNNPFARAVRKLHIILAFASEGRKTMWQLILAQVIEQLVLDVRSANAVQAFSVGSADAYYLPEFDVASAAQASWAASSQQHGTASGQGSSPVGTRRSPALAGAGTQG